jgi:predicted dinucleotide-binding enzyme
MHIGIMGAGHIGATVGRLWSQAGHDVCFGTRHPEELSDLVSSLGGVARSGTPLDAAAFGEVILLAVPLKAVPELATAVGSMLAGKVVLDATNPYPERDGEAAHEALARGSSSWTAAQLPGARVVKAFNMQRYSALEAESAQAGPEVRMGDGGGREGRDGLAIAIAGDDEGAVQVAERLVKDAGFEPVVVGRLEQGRAFDPGTPHYANGVHASELRRELAEPRVESFAPRLA